MLGGGGKFTEIAPNPSEKPTQSFPSLAINVLGILFCGYSWPFHSVLLCQHSFGTPTHQNDIILAVSGEISLHSNAEMLAVVLEVAMILLATSNAQGLGTVKVKGAQCMLVHFFWPSKKFWHPRFKILNFGLGFIFFLYGLFGPALFFWSVFFLCEDWRVRLGT